MRILIAEDDQETADSSSAAWNSSVIIQSSPRTVDALHLLSTEQFDVAVVDRMLAVDGRIIGPAPDRRRASNCRCCC